MTAWNRQRTGLRPITTIGVCVALVVTACSSSGSSATPTTQQSSTTASNQPASPVPSQYRVLFEQLSSELDGYASAVASMPTLATPATAPPVPGTELLVANGNRLSSLLQPGTMTAVDQSLDSLRRLGVGGVTLGIKLPMLLPAFGPDSSAYTSFYATVADHARARGLKISVELGALFCNTPYANCNYQFPGSLSGFAAMTAQQAQIVVSRIHPDYLTVLAEPSTEAALTRIADFGTPSGAASYVQQVLSALGPHPGTLIGAGGSTWEPLNFDQALLAEPIDYLDTHLYPIGANEVSALIDQAQLAHQAGKPIVADEVWLYKTTTPNSAPTASTAVMRLDNFSFFEPLDARFLAITGQWARKAGAAYVSAFWGSHFFAYVDWTPQLDTLSYAQLSQQINTAYVQAAQAGQTTEPGRSWPSDVRG